MALGYAGLEAIGGLPILRHVFCVVLVHLERLAHVYCPYPEAKHRSPDDPPDIGTSTCPDRQDEVYDHCLALQQREAPPNNLVHTMRDDEPIKLIWELNTYLVGIKVTVGVNYVQISDTTGYRPRGMCDIGHGVGNIKIKTLWPPSMGSKASGGNDCLGAARV